MYCHPSLCPCSRVSAQGTLWGVFLLQIFHSQVHSVHCPQPALSGAWPAWGPDPGSGGWPSLGTQEGGPLS